MKKYPSCLDFHSCTPAAGATVQGALELLFNMKVLCELSGMTRLLSNPLEPMVSSQDCPIGLTTATRVTPAETR